MDRGRTWLAITLLIVATALTSCDGGRRYRDELAVIEVSSDGSLGIDAGVQVTPPDTVEAGRAAHVRIRTYGGGCLVRDQERGGRTFVDLRGRTAVLVPFDEPGRATIRVRGISSVAYPDRIIEVAFPLEVVSRRSG